MSKAKPTAKPVEKAEAVTLAPIPVEQAQPEASAPAVEALASEPASAPAVVEQPIPAPGPVAPDPAAVLPGDAWGRHSNSLYDPLHAHSFAPAQPVESLDDFLRRIECAHIDRDVYAVAATHPEATERVWPGTYSGIRLSRGDVSVTYSDGTQA